VTTWKEIFDDEVSIETNDDEYPRGQQGEGGREEDERATHPERRIAQVDFVDVPIEIPRRSHVDEEDVDYGENAQILTRRLPTKAFAKKNFQAENITDGTKDHQAWIEDPHQD
jgi:hypothetical protein